MSDESSFIDARNAAFHKLRQLQAISRANLPVFMLQRPVQTFTLQPEPTSEQAVGRVQVIVYPQDPFVSEPEIRTMNRDDVRPGLVNARIQIRDSIAAPAQPDAEGNYLYWEGTPEFDQVNSFYYTSLTLRMYERYAKRALPWAFASPRITVDPHVGSEANAFYNEQEQMLGFHSFTLNNQSVSTAQSADIVSHEAGHAVLDGLRDLWNESFGLGPTAFHEAFGDMSAMLVALHDDSLLRRVLELTDGDLRMDNFISAIAEQLIDVLRREDNAVPHTRPVYLRNALNMLKSQPFDALVYDPPEPEFTLGRQAHNYSRLFTGAFYDILTGIYDQLRHEMADHVALTRARDTAGQLLVAAVECGPVGEFDFRDTGLSLLAADRLLFAGAYAEIIIDVCASERGLGTVEEYRAFQQRPLPDLHLPDALNSALASALYLEEEVVPALGLPADHGLVPLSTYRNAVGSAYITYFAARSVTLEGAQFEAFDGAALDLFGGLTLTFDHENRLQSAFYRPVTDEDVRQVQVMIADLIHEGLIAPVLNGQLEPDATLGVLMPTSEKPKLVKYPAKVDEPGRFIRDFLQYLQQLLKRQ